MKVWRVNDFRSTLINPQMCIRDRVIYDKEKQYDILSQKISDSVLRNLNNAVNDRNSDEIYRKSKILVFHILQDAIMCKNTAFQEEKE